MQADPFGWTAAGRQGLLAIDIWAATQASPEGMAQRRHERWVQLLRAARRTPRYAAWLAGRRVDRVTLQMVPPSDKRTLMAEFDRGVADPAVTLDALRTFCAQPGCAGRRFLDRYWVWESSGSTGEPGLFVQDDAAMAVYDQLEAARRSSPRPWLRWLDPLYLGERFAFVGVTGGHFASFVTVQRLQAMSPWPGHSRCVSILQPTPALVAELDAFEPSIVATYPSAAVLLADEAAAGRLRCRPREVWTGGETLTDPMRQHIEQAWSTSVRNSYGASEFLPIAWECRAGRLHVNADWVILEAVDAQGRPVPAGQVSHTTLLTNLANHVQPIIRFDIGDRIRLDARACPCGCTLPTVQVQGRADDAFEVPGRDGRSVRLLPLALTVVLEEQLGVFDFQLVQRSPRWLQLGLGPRAGHGLALRRRCREALAAFAADQGALPVRVTTHEMPAPAPQRSGKRQRIVGRVLARTPAA